jgi:hypothetical protein
MNLISSAKRRSLKIEAEGDAWKKRIKPKIRLVGRWLEQAGFKPGHRVEVTCVAPGVMELRFAPADAVQDIRPTVSQTVSEFASARAGK